MTGTRVRADPDGHRNVNNGKKEQVSGREEGGRLVPDWMKREDQKRELDHRVFDLTKRAEGDPWFYTEGLRGILLVKRFPRDGRLRESDGLGPVRVLFFVLQLERLGLKQEVDRGEQGRSDGMESPCVAHNVYGMKVEKTGMTVEGTH